MLFHRPSQFKSSLTLNRKDSTPSFTNVLVAGLLGIHLTLITVGTFCASTAINTNPSHHQDHQSATSILCVWACQVGQITASATPTENLAPLPFLIFVGIVLPPTIPAVFSLFSFAAPRGPPLL